MEREEKKFLGEEEERPILILLLEKWSNPFNPGGNEAQLGLQIAEYLHMNFPEANWRYMSICSVLYKYRNSDPEGEDSGRLTWRYWDALSEGFIPSDLYFYYRLYTRRQLTNFKKEPGEYLRGYERTEANKVLVDNPMFFN